MPPYLPKITVLLLASFLSPPVLSPPPEEEQGMMVEIIELFSLTEPLELLSFCHSASEPEARGMCHFSYHAYRAFCAGRAHFAAASSSDAFKRAPSSSDV